MNFIGDLQRSAYIENVQQPSYITGVDWSHPPSLIHADEIKQEEEDVAAITVAEELKETVSKSAEASEQTEETVEVVEAAEVEETEEVKTEELAPPKPKDQVATRFSYYCKQCDRRHKHAEGARLHKKEDE